MIIEVPYNDDICSDREPNRGADYWEDIRRDVDALFQALGAGNILRKVVGCQMEGCSMAQTAARCGIDQYVVRCYLVAAGKMLLHSGVLAPGTIRQPERQGRSDARESSTARPRFVGHGCVRRRPPKDSPRILCPCCEARLRPLSPVQSFGWRDVYYSEVHRYTRRR